MGQRIEVSTSVVGDVLMLDTDRSITGQEGSEYDSAASADAGDRFPGRLAARMFGSDTEIDHILVGSNVVVVRRTVAWDETSIRGVSAVVGDFFLVYPGATGTG